MVCDSEYGLRAVRRRDVGRQDETYTGRGGDEKGEETAEEGEGEAAFFKWMAGKVMWKVAKKSSINGSRIDMIGNKYEFKLFHYVPLWCYHLVIRGQETTISTPQHKLQQPHACDLWPADLSPLGSQ